MVTIVKEHKDIKLFEIFMDTVRNQKRQEIGCLSNALCQQISNNIPYNFNRQSFCSYLTLAFQYQNNLEICFDSPRNNLSH